MRRHLYPREFWFWVQRPDGEWDMIRVWAQSPETAEEAARLRIRGTGSRLGERAD